MAVIIRYFLMIGPCLCVHSFANSSVVDVSMTDMVSVNPGCTCDMLVQHFEP